jgi:hypothetical protein
VSTRTELADLVRGILPRRGWTVLAYEDDLDEITTSTVLISLQRIRRHPQAPQGALLETYKLRLAVPSEVPATRAQQLDTAAEALLLGLEGLGSGIAWEEATKVLHRDRYLALDVDVTVTSTRTPTEPTTTKRKR